MHTTQSQGVLPIDKELLKENAHYLANPERGILAADESAKTCCLRFEGVHLDCTEESRRAFREMIITTPKLEDYISGIILTDETIRQSLKGENAETFVNVLISKGIKPGIKVDEGITGFKDEHDIEFITKGTDGLAGRIPEYRNMGAAFAKWRAAFSVTHGLPTAACLEANVQSMVTYALVCQENNIVPIVEPEVIMDGTHSISDMAETMKKVIGAVIDGLKSADVYMPGVILKTSMALSGKNADNRASAEEVAEETLAVLKETVPDSIGGVVFLSGGQSFEEVNANYDAIMRRKNEVPFSLAYSFSRAFQNNALKHYANDPQDVSGSQKVLIDSIARIANPH